MEIPGLMKREERPLKALTPISAATIHGSLDMAGFLIRTSCALSISPICKKSLAAERDIYLENGTK